MKVLVTGGAGFIGSHLCEVLINNGKEVICIDNMITGNLKNIPKDVQFIRHDITKPINVKCDEIYHFASPASPKDFSKYPIEILLTNAIGTKNILDVAKKNNAKVLFASTSEVYGDPLVIPQPEEYWGNVNPIGERSCYDESKRFAEAMCFAYMRKYGVNMRIIRIFNTYGPRMRLDDGRVIPNFITQALRNKEITIYGNGKQTRSFCYISDLINGIKIAMSQEKYKVLNIGNPHEITIIELAHLIKELTHSDSILVFKSLPKDDPKRRCPDISKIQSLGWKPKVTLKQGLKKTIEWFKDKINE